MKTGGRNLAEFLAMRGSGKSGMNQAMIQTHHTYNPETGETKEQEFTTGKRAKRSSIERRHCSDRERFTFALVRATARMETAKRMTRRRRTKLGAMLLKEHRLSATYHHDDAAVVAAAGLT